MRTRGPCGPCRHGCQLCTTYRFTVASTDVAGNVAVDDDAGAMFRFSTECPPAPPVPNGTGGAAGMAVASVSSAQMLVTWENDCVATGPTKLIYGPLEAVSSYGTSGALCGIPAQEASVSWTYPAGDVWFLAIKENAVGVEGSWGTSTTGERSESANSGLCGTAAKEVVATCP